MCPNKNCEDTVVKFFSPASKFGGDKPQPSCPPNIEKKVPEVLREPVDKYEQPVEKEPLQAIIIGNRSVREKCSDLEGGEANSSLFGTDVYIDRNTYTAELKLQSYNINKSVLTFIENNNLIATITTALQSGVDGAVNITAEELSSISRIPVSIAATIIADAIRTQDRLTLTASEAAKSMLICYYLNEPITAECPDTAMAKPTEHPDAVFSFTVPFGVFSSTVSQDEANLLARAYAESQLVCFYISDAQSVRCTDTERPGYISDEEVPNDREPVRSGLPLRVGSYVVAGGLFTSTISKEDANTQARNYGYSMLECFYINEAIDLSCIDMENARGLGDNPAEVPSVAAVITSPTQTGQTVRIPKGFIVSLLGTPEANEEAQVLAESLLECCFINPELEIHCPDYEVKDSKGNVLYTIPASELDGYEDSVVVPAGTFTGCELDGETQESVTAKAMEYGNTMLNCYYCNLKILPTCVPQWVITAADSGITLERDIELVTGEVLYAGDIYSLDLPIEPSTLINPYTGELEDISTWAIDAMMGIPSDMFCSTDPGYIEVIPDTVNPSLEELTPEECTFVNDDIAVGCSFDTTGMMHAYSKFDYSGAGKYLSKNSNTPPGEYIIIPSGTVTVTFSDVPDLPPADSDEFDEAYAYVRAKEYANMLALEMGKSMLTCFWENKDTTGTCYGPSTVATLPPNLSIWELDRWYISAGHDPALSNWLALGSNTRDNPIEVPEGMFQSMESPSEVWQQVYEFITSVLECMYTNAMQTCNCTSGIQANAAIVPKGTIIADTHAEANTVAKDLACSMLACVDPTGSGGKGEKGDDGAPGQAGGVSCAGQCFGVYS